MSHSTTNGAMRVLEQGSLLGGADLMPLLNGNGRKKRARKPGAAPKKVGFAKALALVVQYGRQTAKEVGKTALSRCPRCGHVGPTEQDFGTRIIRGERRPQSWCRNCRKVHLPPLKALPDASGRDVKATRVDTANEKPAKARRSTSPSDGLLFPPEAMAGRKRRDS
ncbi:zinc ribbon domain-containing protein [Vitiosangium sp. GDMCC 1.1324]|uniref:zinc ribbon domain-containing protein n=1 Tax=Vitiosangium sp. (strain GDMCC 1.1324) TaxID=2138576 RepID=UPI000D3B0DC5|nr:zinc ribbon domain-containing protein [Vitiosangium sp. GDMCC 1.1324]PTL83323.1 hypothetical protein DAT35_15165 [Vitiosangium sp. GDMCC 1.1324]